MGYQLFKLVKFVCVCLTTHDGDYLSLTHTHTHTHTHIYIYTPWDDWGLFQMVEKMADPRRFSILTFEEFNHTSQVTRQPEKQWPTMATISRAIFLELSRYSFLIH